MAKSIIGSRTQTLTENIPYPKRDRFERTIGLRIYRYECELIPAPTSVNGRVGFYELDPGHYYVTQVHTTKNGTPNGPYQGLEFFSSEEKREAFIQARIKTFIKGQQRRERIR